MSYRGAPSVNGDGPRAPESGGKRKKLAGYLKQANELRQSYAASWNAKDGSIDNCADDIPGAFPDAVITRGGNEEMVLFPGYARKHSKTKPRAEPGTIQEVGGTGRDYRDTAGAGDAEFWKSQWEQYENDRAIVDVDVRGWIYNPHKGPMSRRHRLMVGLARQLVGLPANSTVSNPSSHNSPDTSRIASRSSSPVRDVPSKREEEIVSQQLAELVRKGEDEAAIAGRGGFSESPSRDFDGRSLYDPKSRGTSPARSSAEHLEVTTDPESLSPLQKRQFWTAPGKMTAAELAVANSHLMARLKPFMANPVANVPISAFFYNEKVSRQRTINTDASGHFHLRAALDFIPTHVRILASDKLSATEEVQITSAQGVSMISDIDDTVKHSAISSGAREIFRNTFIRDLGDLTIDGVKPWYNKLADMGVKIHYVSNSPWQLYPLLTTFFKMSGLPRGSYHLKQYSGMLQGIFEPVAERKKATMERIMRDFPQRKFILIGDSGEADLEVYTDTVLEYPGRILGIFIRDVTTPHTKGFFDPSLGPLSNGPGVKHVSKHRSTDSLTNAKILSRPEDIQDDEAELRAAIAASLKDMEEETARTRRSIFSEIPIDASFPMSDANEKRPTLPPRRPTEPPAPQQSVLEENLIDFSDDESPPTISAKSTHAVPQIARPPVGRTRKELPPPPKKVSSPPPPAPPAKPLQFRVPSPAAAAGDVVKKPPPKPTKPSTTINTLVPSPLSQNSPIVGSDTPKFPPEKQTHKHTYGSSAKKKISSAYNVIPSISGTSPTKSPKSASSSSADEGFIKSSRPLKTSSTARSMDDLKPPPPLSSLSQYGAPPPPPRRNLTAYPTPGHNNLSAGTWGPDSSTTNGGWDGGAYQTPLNKKEEMWQRRWARAKEAMERRGVVLRAWRVGSDVEDVCLTLVRQAMKEIEADERDEIQDRSRK